jgi:hypothetical protein
MAFFENFTTSIKQKWLDYFQTNRGWLSLQMENHSVRTPDGGRRPSSYLILGVVNAIEPKLGNLMVPFYRLNANEDALVEVLGLNFDPDMELSKESGTTVNVRSSNAASNDLAGLLPDSQEQEQYDPLA